MDRLMYSALSLHICKDWPRVRLFTYAGRVQNDIFLAIDPLPNSRGSGAGLLILQYPQHQ